MGTRFPLAAAFAISACVVAPVMCANVSTPAGDLPSPADEQWRETKVVRDDGARHPALVEVNGRLILFWAHPPVWTTDGYGPYGTGRDASEWPMLWVDITDYQGRVLKEQGRVGLPLNRGDAVAGRLALATDGRYLTIVSPRGMWDSRSSQDAAVYASGIAGGQNLRHALLAAFAAPPQAVLPHALASAKAPLDKPPEPDSPLAKWFAYPTTPDRDFSRLDLCYDGLSKLWYLCGEDHVAKTVWVTSSADGRVWREPVVLGRGPGFPAVAARGGNVIVNYTDAGQFTYMVIWPDDVPGSKRVFWPPGGQLKYRLSNDGGQTWGDPQTLVDAQEVISSRCAWGPDGTIWVVYVKLEGYGSTTALWLTYSRDNGKTWREPKQITEGKRVDRDVDIMVWHDRVIVAFSRCLKPGGWNSIWLWQEEIGNLQ